ncbi:cilia- and flagella-associated protein 77 isoform X2 [Girardinichthys multiradiatus]|nr:cilia- and flagella-associated protein 77 isoform X2 [Girardinichthys multiradiatus]
MTSPRLGVVRKSMLMDPLLIKAPLGRTRSRGLTIPGPDFTFGTSSLIRDGGVTEALSSWRVQSRRENHTQHLDFVSLNRDAVRSGLMTSKELSQYRAQRGGVKAQKQTTEHHEGRTSRRPPVVPDITFGVRNRPSSPLADLLSHQYGHRWMDQQLNRNQTSNHKHTIKLDRPAETRTSLLRKSRSVPVKQTPFKLPQFSQIPPALDTFRDPGARQRSGEVVRIRGQTIWTNLGTEPDMLI